MPLSSQKLLFCLFRASLAYVHLREQRSCMRQTGCLWEDKWERVNLTRKFVYVYVPASVCANPRKDFLWMLAAWEFCGSSRRWHGEKQRKREGRQERAQERESYRRVRGIKGSSTSQSHFRDTHAEENHPQREVAITAAALASLWADDDEHRPTSVTHSLNPLKHFASIKAAPNLWLNQHKVSHCHYRKQILLKLSLHQLMTKY